MKRIVWSCVGLVLGVLFIVGAVIGLNSDRVECGGETMREGDVCVSKTRGGRVTENSLEETKGNATFGAIMGIGFGVLTIVIAAQNLRIGLRARRQAQQAGLQQFGPQQQPMPQQGWHPQHQPAPQPIQYQPQQGWQQPGPYPPPQSGEHTGPPPQR